MFSTAFHKCNCGYESRLLRCLLKIHDKETSRKGIAPARLTSFCAVLRVRAFYDGVLRPFLCQGVRGGRAGLPLRIGGVVLGLWTYFGSSITTDET